MCCIHQRLLGEEGIPHVMWIPDQLEWLLCVRQVSGHTRSPSTFPLPTPLPNLGSQGCIHCFPHLPLPPPIQDIHCMYDEGALWATSSPSTISLTPLFSDIEMLSFMVCAHYNVYGLFTIISQNNFWSDRETSQDNRIMPSEKLV